QRGVVPAPADRGRSGARSRAGRLRRQPSGGGDRGADGGNGARRAGVVDPAQSCGPAGADGTLRTTTPARRREASGAARGGRMSKAMNNEMTAAGRYWPRVWWRMMEMRTGVIPLPVYLTLLAVIAYFVSSGKVPTEINMMIALLAVLA